MAGRQLKGCVSFPEVFSLPWQEKALTTLLSKPFLSCQTCCQTSQEEKLLISCRLKFEMTKWILKKHDVCSNMLLVALHCSRISIIPLRPTVAVVWSPSRTFIYLFISFGLPLLVCLLLSWKKKEKKHSTEFPVTSNNKNEETIEFRGRMIKLKEFMTTAAALTFLGISLWGGEHLINSEGIGSLFDAFVLYLLDVWQAVHGTAKISLPCLWIRTVYTWLVFTWFRRKKKEKKSLICLFVVNFREQLHHYGGNHFWANQCYQYAYWLLLTL